jgi:hypothetical protein
MSEEVPTRPCADVSSDDAMDLTGHQMPTDLNHYYKYGDVYDALAACDELEMLLSRLKRRNLLSDQQWSESAAHVASIRRRVQHS